MKMKQLFRYTSTIMLRTALLLGAIAFVNAQIKAQTAEQWAEMPDAFETMDPTSIIDDGNYYYIQFYTTAHDRCSYLTDCGVNQIARSKDFLPYANDRLWTLVKVNGDNDATHFKLKNKAGHYLYLETGGSARAKCTDTEEAASILKLTPLGSGYDISAANNDAYPMARNGNNEWEELICNFTRRGSREDWTRLRFAKLKSTAAFIIYYRGEGIDNTDPTVATTRHYLTYSGTGNESPLNDGNLRSSAVSSRQSIIPSDKPLCTLPTLAAYHQDGLWTLEEADTDGEFYIKKYGSADEYLNADGTLSVLGAKNDLFGKYALEDPFVNRYTRIRNLQFQTEQLESNWFNNSNVAFHIGETITDVQAANGYTIVGDGNVNHEIYADLSGYTKMIINGTQNMQLRVLMNRQWQDGPLVEKIVTIGSDGKAEVDLTNLTLNTTQTGSASVRMTYIDGSDGTLDGDGNNLPNNVDTPIGMCL